MNIAPTQRIGGGPAASRKGEKTRGSGFSGLLSGAGAAETSAVAAPSGPAVVGAVVALQGVDDATSRRSRGLREGETLLDELEALRRQILLGQVSVAQLQRLAQRYRARKPTGDASLDAILADIELRVAVELAKLGQRM